MPSSSNALGEVTLKSSLAVHGPWVHAGGKCSPFVCATVGEEIEGGAGRKHRRVAFAWGDKAYVLPIWSSIQTELEIKDGYAWFAWQPSRKGWPNIVNAGDPTYVVMLCPDGTAETRVASQAGVIGGKPYFVRPADCGLPPDASRKLAGMEVLVWGGISGRPLKEIRDIVDSRGVPVYLGRSDGEFWMGSTQVVMRHPGQVLYEGKGEVTCMFSDTPDARPTESTVRGFGPKLILQEDGSVVWAAETKRGRATVYRDGEAVYSGSFIAFHRGKRSKTLTVIGRGKRRNDRTIEKIGR